MEEDEGTQEPFNIEHRRDISSHVKHIDCIQNSRCFSLRENCESMTFDEWKRPTVCVEPESVLEKVNPFGREGTIVANSWVFPPRRMTTPPERSCRLDIKLRKGTAMNELDSNQKSAQIKSDRERTELTSFFQLK